MPEVPDAIPIPVTEPPAGGGENPPMAEPVCEGGNFTMAVTSMANGIAELAKEFNAVTGRRVSRFDQLAADSAAMWAVALTSPTVMAGMGYQAAAGHMPPRQTEVGVASAGAPGAGKAGP